MDNLFRKMALCMLGCMFGALLNVLLAGEKPQFSNGTSSFWYTIRFQQEGVYLSDNGINNICTVEYGSKSAGQQWKLIGDESNFYLVSKNNNYAFIENGVWDEHSNNCPLKTSRQKPNQGFRLVNTGTSYVIESLKNTGFYLNTWGGTGAGTSIGIWNVKNDANNFVTFENTSEVPFSLTGIKNYKPSEKLTLWYTTPAKDNRSGNPWMEYSLPIGNGQLGASVFAGVRNDEIVFNEKTLWTGRSTDTGENGNEYGSYQVFGSVFIKQNNVGTVTNYLRDLNLANATASMKYTLDGVDYERKYIVSNPDSVMAVHLTANQPGKISVSLSMDPKMMAMCSTSYTKSGVACDAHFSGHLEVVDFDARMRVVADGGSVNASKGSIDVANANSVTVYLAAGTNYDINNPAYISNTRPLLSVMEQRVEQAVQKGWETLYSDHVADYKTFFDRVRFDLKGSENTMDTQSLVSNYRGGISGNDLMLEQLYFNYGRYLEIASSRGVDLPSNLQGIWANNNKSAWNADIHANINVQMNYWPAETTNMSEMHEPFLNYIIKMSESEQWKGYARAAGEKRGWTCYTENNIFGGVGVWAHNYVIANAWYCTHLWQHYRYTLNEKFLKKAFPTMLSATQFWLDRLILRDGKYLCPDEYSPEHGPKKEDGVAHAQQLVWELFDNTLKAVSVLGEKECGISSSDLRDLRDKFSLLDKGLAVETGRNGEQLLREWKYSNYTVGNPGHRHLSHLMCLYPFNQVNSDSEFFQPAINSLIDRGDPSTGWSMGWKINLWARALNGNHAHDILKMALRHSTSYDMDEGRGGIYYNLFDSHAPFQIDGNFGACSGIAEMLFQSHSEVLDFLPALPETWSSGSVTGLKGVGNFTIGVEWKTGKASKVTIVNNKGKRCLVRCSHALNTIDKVLVTVNDKVVVPVAQGKGVYEIPSSTNDSIVIDFTQEPGAPEPELVYDGVCGENLSWHLDAQTGIMTIEGSGAMYDFTNRNIPTWNPVAGEVKSMVLTKNLTHIGNNAFVQMVNLPTLVFSDNEITFGQNAFAASTKVVLNIVDEDYQTTDLGTGAKNFILNENTYDEMMYERILPINKWATLVLPFVPDLSGLWNYHFYALTEATPDALVFTLTDKLQPNTPYLYKRTANSQQCPMKSVEGKQSIQNVNPQTSAGSSWMMNGSYKHITFQGTDLQEIYVMSGGKILNSTNEVTVMPFRSYFRGPKYSKVMRVVIQDKDGGETDITNEIMDQMEEDGAIYDILGRKVEETIPGNIYIRNHKKFLAQ